MLNTISNRDLFNLMDVMFSPRAAELTRTPQLSLPIDVFEKDGTLSVRAALPGVAPENVEINVEDNVLTITGENHSSHQDTEAKIYRRENVYGQFRRSVRISEEFDVANANATFSNGVVTISIPRSVTAKPKVVKIPVTAGVEQSSALPTATVETTEPQA